MGENPAPFGHLGLMFGLLGIIIMLGFVNFAVDPGGYAMSAVFLPVILWLVWVMIVALGLRQPGDSAKP